MPVWLTIAFTAVGVLVPVGTLIGLAVNHGRALERMTQLDKRVDGISANCTHCQDRTSEGDNALHSRVTELARDVAGVQATMAAHGDRLNRVEGRLNGHH